MTRQDFRRQSLHDAQWDANHAAYMRREHRISASTPLYAIIALAAAASQQDAVTSILLSLGCIPLYLIAWLYIQEAERCRRYWMEERQKVLEQLWRVG
jgi:hypothetical protein